MKNLSRKEAMEILNDMKVKIEIPKAAVMQYKRNAALDMAIEALRCSETPNTSDTISRQKAVEVLHFWEKKYIWDEDCLNEDAKDIVVSPSKMIEKLPSAQPDRSLWFRIGELCVDESKGNITAEVAIKKIRALLRAETIYCKDCKYRDSFNYCTYKTRAGWITKDNGHCSEAERREE